MARFPRHSVRRIAVAACAAAALGCADNAVFDIEIVVPPGAGYAVVDARPGPALQSAEVLELEPTHPAFALSATAPTTIRVSVMAEHLEEDVDARILFCGDEDCTMCASGECVTTAPSVCIRFERPFHSGCVSTFRGALSVIPEPRVGDAGNCSTTLRIVEECAVGCADGNWLEDGMFCPMGPETHGSDR